MVSIIIPVYNQADKIGRCLNSILSQTYKDYEVIIVNDGSTDNLELRIKNFCLAGPFRHPLRRIEARIEASRRGDELRIKRFQFVSQENQGAAVARNNGFKLAKGDYLLFCDADAELAPKALETMLKALEANQTASYAYSSFKWGRKIFKLWPFDAERLKRMPYIHTMALIRREHFPGFDPVIKKFQDWDLWLTMLEKGHIGVWIDKILFKVAAGGTISSWLPSFAYKFFPFLPQVKKYNEAMKIIKEKHKLIMPDIVRKIFNKK